MFFSINAAAVMLRFFTDYFSFAFSDFSISFCKLCILPKIFVLFPKVHRFFPGKFPAFYTLGECGPVDFEKIKRLYENINQSNASLS